jgi:hypothetical protein
VEVDGGLQGSGDPRGLRREVSKSDDDEPLVYDPVVVEVDVPVRRIGRSGYLERAEVVATFTADGSIPCCAIRPDGVTIVAGESSGRVHFLQRPENA